MANNTHLMLDQQIQQEFGFTKNQIRLLWPNEPNAPKGIKLGSAANSRKAYLRSEVEKYVALLVAQREQAIKEASESARRAAKVSADRRARRRAGEDVPVKRPRRARINQTPAASP